MKKKISLAIGLILALSITMGTAYSWNPFSKSDWKKVGTTITSGFQDVGNWLDKEGKKLEEKLKNIPSCAEVVPLATQWAAKRATYEVSLGILEAAKKLQNADPRRIAIKAEIAALETEKAALLGAKGSLDATKKTARIGLNATEELAKFTGDMTTFLSKVSKAIDIEKAGFSTGFKSLKQGNIIELTLKGEILNHKFNANKVKFNWKNMSDGINSVVKSIISLASGGKISTGELDKITDGSIAGELPDINLPEETPPSADIDQAA